MFRRMVIGAVVLVALFAAPAAAQYRFTITPGEVSSGGTVSFSGEGCEPFAEVTIVLTPKTSTKAIGDGVTIATITADEKGEFSGTFEVPADTEVGVYVVEAYCGGERVATAELNVVAPGTTPTTTVPASGGPIVRTGSDLNGLGMLGAGLLVAGGIVMIATRNRRRQATAA